MIIQDCPCGNRCEGRTNQCATCNARDRKAARLKPADNNGSINKRSEKGSKIDARYNAKLRIWKRGKVCTATFKHDCSRDVTCHHMHGRSDNSYFDEYAEEKGIVLTLDDRFWKPLCSESHRIITNDSKFAWENGYSFKRVADPIFRKDIQN